MIIVMKPGAPQSAVQSVAGVVRDKGLETHLSQGEQVTIIGVVGDKTRLNSQQLQAMPYVDRIVPITESYKLSNRKFHPQPTRVKVGNHEIGPDTLTIMAGPCAVETEEQLMTIARAVKKSGAQIVRGGAYKPRTSPYAYQGMGPAGLDLLCEASAELDMPIVTEIMDPRDVQVFLDKKIDVMQIGARNAQNFPLLKEVGKTQTPILLKRGMSGTIDELLMAAEYIMSEGNDNVILCERGIRTFETRTRNTFDLNAVPVLHHLSHLPVVADPSHATGYTRYVEPMALAATACGANGLEIEVHDEPSRAWSDGAQALTPDQFDDTMRRIRAIREVVCQETME